MTGRPPTAGPKRDRLVKILVTADMHEQLVAAARQEGRSVSDWGMRAFERELEASRKRSKP